ncbi:sterol desaturase family protein [Qipengyuania sp. DGS5-3]|uniref:sterol desaturase family protein n=1 Tax=Qipengyuania sp. DGS5-3 TaxID=3349632 RepID=UPI0036D2A56F
MDITSEISALWAIGVMAAVFIGFAILEAVVPHRRLRHPRGQRWFTNLSLFVLDTVLVRAAIPLLMIGAAGFAQMRGWGLLNLVELPVWAEFIIAFLLLDLIIYAQHRITHRIPFLWRMHKVHHADPDFDITTAARFHPFEIMLSMLYKMSCVVLIGPAVLAVFLFEVIFNAATIFTHANVGLPPKIDRLVRLIFVTPDMHRIHHSVHRTESDSNYGTLLSVWDRVFGSYSARSRGGRHDLTIGMPDYQDSRPNGLGFSLTLPFKSETPLKEDT